MMATPLCKVFQKLPTRHSVSNKSQVDGCSTTMVCQYSGSNGNGPKKPIESFLTGTSGTYVEDMYKIWQKDPSSVHASWNSYFSNELKGKTYQAPPNLITTTTPNITKPASTKLIKQVLDYGVKKQPTTSSLPPVQTKSTETTGTTVVISVTGPPKIDITKQPTAASAPSPTEANSVAKTVVTIETPVGPNVSLATLATGPSKIGITKQTTAAPLPPPIGAKPVANARTQRGSNVSPTTSPQKIGFTKQTLAAPAPVSASKPEKSTATTGTTVVPKVSSATGPPKIGIKKQPTAFPPSPPSPIEGKSVAKTGTQGRPNVSSATSLKKISIAKPTTAASAPPSIPAKSTATIGTTVGPKVSSATSAPKIGVKKQTTASPPLPSSPIEGKSVAKTGTQGGLNVSSTTSLKKISITKPTTAAPAPLPKPAKSTATTGTTVIPKVSSATDLPKIGIKKQATASPPLPPSSPIDGKSVTKTETQGGPNISSATVSPKIGVKKQPTAPSPPSIQTKSTTTTGTTIGPSILSTTGSPKKEPVKKPGVSSGKSEGKTSGGDQTIEHHLAVAAVIRSYQARGHLVAQVDPLGILFTDRTTTITDRYGHPPDQITRQHKMQMTDMDKTFTLPTSTYIGGDKKELQLAEIINRLEMAYCRHIGVEYMYIHSLDQANWIRERIEPVGSVKISKDQKILTMKRIARAHAFEAFLAKKYTSEKRFGLEGGEVLIPALKQLIDVSSMHGVEGVNIAMAHRGRLNVLANVCRKPLDDILTQFAGLEAADTGSGDVKYHLGTVSIRENRVTKKQIRMSILANPSHLESVNPLCLGKTRAEQLLQGDYEGKKVLAVIIHGDASFSGQGICYESFHLSYLPNYTTHGSIHVVVNNQVGFTTDPRFSRSSPYCTDLGRVVNAPIFHVNGDDPESVIHVCNIAADWRAKFHQDVVIDLVTYRRNGHNELDEPMFTQPLMYQKIRKLAPLVQIYANKLIQEKVITQDELDGYMKRYLQICEDGFAKAKKQTSFKYRDWLDSPWKGFFKNFKFEVMPKTGIKEEDLKHIGTKFSTEPPKEFVIHKGIQRILKNRRKMVDARIADWSIGEAFAYTSLLHEGIHVRLSGQDVERGTFGHRHHILHHQTKDKDTYNMIAGIYPNQAPYMVCNSSLSEYAVSGFELGYSQVSPKVLVMWEAQFGDFANTAQVIIDQFLSCGETKWARQSGLVILLPHAMEGMGPEHSSARLERYLQMSDDDVIQQADYDEKFVLKQHLDINWFVANCTTPASVFHLLRRQIHLPFRKPAVLMTPKSVLRNPAARSSFDDFLEGTEFQRLIPEKGPASQKPENVKKLVFCSGKTYYDIMDWIRKNKLEEAIAVARAEQLSPFPYDLISKEMKIYSKAKVFWAQEEHKNQGGWLYMKDRIVAASNGQRPCEYIGRPVAGSPSTGNKAQHLKEVADYTAELIRIN